MENKSTMYKTIVPDLVSIDTNLKKLNGFIMCQDFDFYPKTKKKNKYHYTLVQDTDIAVPQDYDFRSEYYLKKGNYWYYDRRVFFWNPKFKFDIKNKIFYFNHDYLLLPVKLGGIFTLGEHLSNLIDLDLFLDGYVTWRGIAYRKNNKNIGISAPGFNGKTTLLKKILKTGARYIAEDYLIIDTNAGVVFPTCPIKEESFWQRRKVNGELAQLSNSTSVISQPVKLDELLFIENSQNPQYRYIKRKITDCLLLNSLYFLNNLFIKSFIYDKGLTKDILGSVDTIEKKLTNIKFIDIKNFDYGFLKNR